MKFLLLLFCFGFANHTPTPMLLIDKNLKKPAQISESFSLELYFKNTFPIYASDVNVVSDGAEKVAKKIYQGIGCYTTDSIMANRSLFIIHTECDRGKEVTVRLVTKMDEATIDCVLLNKESNMRKAQEKLLNFSAYLKK